MRTSALATRLAVVLLLATLSAAQTPSITIDQIHSEQVTGAAKVPKAEWLDDGTAIVYNERAPEAQRTFESFDPATGALHRILDMAKALASLRPLMASASESERELKVLGWPEEFDHTGSQAIYTFGKDVFLLNLPSATFTRITNSPSEEKAPHFSPDSRKVAYVRDNDLYVYDIAGNKETRLTSDGTENVLNGTLT